MMDTSLLLLTAAYLVICGVIGAYAYSAGYRKGFRTGSRPVAGIGGQGMAMGTMRIVENDRIIPPDYEDGNPMP